jgi:hypothetical protein
VTQGEAIAQAVRQGHTIVGEWDKEYAPGWSREHPDPPYYAIGCLTCEREIIAWPDGTFGGSALTRPCDPLPPPRQRGTGWRHLIQRLTTL